MASIDWAAIKEIVVSGAAAATAVAAYLGLFKWRQELRGKAHFDCARNLARATYRLRNALQAARSPMIWASEFPDHPQTTSDERARAYGHVFTNRWQPLREALQELDAATLEAEALWGTEVVAKVEALRKCVGELNAATDAYVRNEASGGRDFDTDRRFGEKMRSRVFATLGDGDNELSSGVVKAVSDIEVVLRQHLRR